MDVNFDMLISLCTRWWNLCWFTLLVDGYSDLFFRDFVGIYMNFFFVAEIVYFDLWPSVGVLPVGLVCGLILERGDVLGF